MDTAKGAVVSSVGDGQSSCRLSRAGQNGSHNGEADNAIVKARSGCHFRDEEADLDLLESYIFSLQPNDVIRDV